MTRSLRGLAISVLGMILMLVAPAQATIIPVTLQFSEANWSGTISFDDTTGQPWTLFSIFTAFAIADMTISDGARTWTEDELDPGASLPPTFGLIVDPDGRAALFFLATDTVSGAELVTQFESSGEPPLITGSELFELGVFHPYTAFLPTAVSVPGTLWFVASGLATLGGVAWRRARR